MHPRIRQRPTEFGFQEVCDTFHHEIDDRLWRVDDAVCVRYVLGESLEKTYRKMY